MHYLNHIVSKSSITVIYEGGVTKVVHSSNEVYNKVLDLIKARDFNAIEKEIDTIERINKDKRVQMNKETRKILIDGEDAPPAMVKILESLVASGEDTKPLIKFWDNLKKNPSKESQERLYDFLLANHQPLTDDGCFIAYKYVTTDFKDQYTKTMDNSPGKTVTMPRESVNSDSSVTCSRGLHAAAFDYVKGNQTIVLVKINPKDVVAVPPDYSNQKMRVCRYEVLEQYKDTKEMTVAKMSVKRAYYLLKFRTKKLLVDKKEITSKTPNSWMAMVRASSLAQAFKMLQEKYGQAKKKKSTKKVVKKSTKKVVKKATKKTKSKKS